jgi:stage II sporulation protein M
MKKAIAIIRENRKIIALTALAFLAMTVVGMLYPYVLSDVREELFAGIVASIMDKGVIDITLFIIWTNVKTAFFSILLGILFYPILGIIINGYILGAVINDTVYENSIAVIWQLFPHGIFELPAILLAFAMGMRIGLCLFKKNRLKNIKIAYGEGLYLLITVIIPLLLIAGAIEGILIATVK